MPQNYCLTKKRQKYWSLVQRLKRRNLRVIFTSDFYLKKKINTFKVHPFLFLHIYFFLWTIQRDWCTLSHSRLDSLILSDLPKDTINQLQLIRNCAPWVLTEQKACTQTTSQKPGVLLRSPSSSLLLFHKAKQKHLVILLSAIILQAAGTAFPRIWIYFIYYHHYLFYCYVYSNLFYWHLFMLCSISQFYFYCYFSLLVLPFIIHLLS